MQRRATRRLSLTADGTIKSNLQKIHELQEELASALEENSKLQSEVQLLRERESTPHKCFNSSRSGDGPCCDVEEMKDMVMALRRVTINQEITLNDTRKQAQHAMLEMEEKNATIKSLEYQVHRLQQEQRRKSDRDLRVKMAQLHRSCFEQEKKNAWLQQELETSRDEVMMLKDRLHMMHHMHSPIRKTLAQQEASCDSLTSDKSPTFVADFDTMYESVTTTEDGSLMSTEDRQFFGRKIRTDAMNQLRARMQLQDEIDQETRIANSNGGGGSTSDDTDSWGTSEVGNLETSTLRSYVTKGSSGIDDDLVYSITEHDHSEGSWQESLMER